MSKDGEGEWIVTREETASLTWADRQDPDLLAQYRQQQHDEAMRAMPAKILFWLIACALFGVILFAPGPVAAMVAYVALVSAVVAVILVCLASILVQVFGWGDD